MTTHSRIFKAAGTSRPKIPGVSLVTQDHVQPGSAPAECYLDYLRRWSAERPDRIFLDYEGKLSSFRDIDLRSTRLGHALMAMGIGPGDRVGTIMDNSDDLVVSFFAISKIGAIWVPVNTAYRGEFLAHQLNDSGAILSICDAQYLDNLLAIGDSLPHLERVLVRGDAQPHKSSEGPPHRGRPDVQPLDDHRGSDESPISVVVRPQDVAVLMYTSGTTGPSKGCILPHSFLCSTARQRNRCVVPQDGMITWSCLPLFHTAATSTVLLANLLAGERAAIASRFSVSGFWDEIERSGATSISLLASMLPLVAHAPDTPAMLRCRGQVKVVTGVPLSVADRQLWQERFGVEYMMTFGYGQTEANMVCFLPWGDAWPPPESMGPPAEEYDVMVADDEGRPVPIGETGELLVRPTSPGVMCAGYWGRPADTLSAMSGLWWHTGDFVRMDEHGYLYFVDRKKDYLRSRGENISSFEVESAILRHPCIAEVACHTVLGEAGREEELKTTAVLRQDASLTERSLFEWCGENLPYFAVPRFIEFRDSLPKTPTGKIQKDILRKEGRTGATWDCEAEGLKIRRR